jgi:hypothetical protein
MLPLPLFLTAPPHLSSPRPASPLQIKSRAVIKI